MFFYFVFLCVVLKIVVQKQRCEQRRRRIIYIESLVWLAYATGCCSWHQCTNAHVHKQPTTTIITTTTTAATTHVVNEYWLTNIHAIIASLKTVNSSSVKPRRVPNCSMFAVVPDGPATVRYPKAAA